MQLETNSNNLLKAINQVSGIITPSNTLPILESILLRLYGNILTVISTDLDITAIHSIEVEGIEDGVVCVSSKTMLDLIKTFNNDTIELMSNECKLSVVDEFNDGAYHIPINDANEFPTTTKVNVDTETKTTSEHLLNVIQKTLPTTGNDELRPIMTGIFFNNSEVASTDAHKLSTIETNIDISFVLPKKGANLLKNILPKDDTEVSITYNDTNAIFDFNDTTIYVRLIDGKYPDYKAVIPTQNNNRLSIDKDELIKVLKRVSLFSNKTTSQVRFDLNSNDVLLSSEDNDYSVSAKTRLNAVYSGEDMSIGFNGKFLIDILNNISCKDVYLDMSEPNRACLIKGEEGYLGLLMPVMLSK